MFFRKIEGGITMGILGTLLSIPVNLANVPLAVMDEIMSDGEDKVFSAPLDMISKELKKIDD